MIISKAKYLLEKEQAKNRIEYLENIICPNLQHDYQKIGERCMYQGSGHGDELYKAVYRCSRCGKEILDKYFSV